MQKDRFASLSNSEFRFFIGSRFLFTIGTQMQGLIVQWQILTYTKNPLLFGMIGLAEAVPFILTALIAGHLADLVDRKKIIIAASSIFLVCSTLLGIFTLNRSQILHSQGIWLVYLVIFLTGISRAFIAPSFFAFLSQIVEREQYPNASTWNSTVWQAGAIAGPALGGLVYMATGITWSYFIVSLLLVISVILVLLISCKPLPARATKDSLAKELSAGIKFVFSNQIMLSALSLDLFAVFFGGAVGLLPLFAAQVIHTGPAGLGLLRAAPSIGAMLAGVLMIYYPPFKRAGKNLLIAVSGYGVCIILFAFSHVLLLSVALLAVSGGFDCISVIIRSTILQVMTPDEMRGRVASVNTIFIGSSNEIGEFESGIAARLLRLVPSVIFGGSMTLLVAGFTAVRAKKLRELSM